MLTMSKFTHFDFAAPFKRGEIKENMFFGKPKVIEIG